MLRNRKTVFSYTTGVILLCISIVLDTRVSAQVSQTRTKKNSVLFQAIDAFRQAKRLERDLALSESSVSDQTKELTRELHEAQSEAGKNPSSFFTREQKLDEQLLRQAQQETQRDARLVAQAKDEMRDDQAYLSSAFQGDDDGPSLHSIPVEPAGEWLSSKCPGMLCVRATTFGYLPAFCALSDPSEVRLRGVSPVRQSLQYSSTIARVHAVVYPLAPRRPCPDQAP
jgi:hypothetical protein